MCYRAPSVQTLLQILQRLVTRMGSGGIRASSHVGLQVDDRKFVKREGASLVLDGRPFFFAGFNNYYMMTRAADSGTRKEVHFPHDASPALDFMAIHLVLESAQRHLREQTVRAGLDV